MRPAPLRNGIDGSSANWHFTQLDGDRKLYDISAANMTSLSPANAADASSMKNWNTSSLKLYHQDGTEFDLVHTDKAQFDPKTKSLYADGKVDITMGVKVEGPPRGRLLKIHTSGVHFDKDFRHGHHGSPRHL